MKKIIYLDNAASTTIDSGVLKKMLPYFKKFYGNPNSVHSLGRKSREAIEISRKIIAESINANPEEIIFVGSSTEANNLAIRGSAKRGQHIITSSIEHKAITNLCLELVKDRIEITYLPVNRAGIISLETLKKTIKKNTALVTLSHANGEIGTIQPIKQIAKICKAKKVLLHLDCSQSFLKLPLDVNKIKIDMITLSSHKIYGPKGIAALYIRKGIKLKPLMYGGGQEGGLRSGTENVSGIVGFGEAVKALKKEDVLKIKKLKDYFTKELLKIPNTSLNGPEKNRLCDNINISFKNIEGEAIIGYLDEYGICASTGSACNSTSLEPNKVLLSIGLSPQEANSSIRLSLGKFNTKNEIKKALKIFKKIVNRLRKISPFA